MKEKKVREIKRVETPKLSKEDIQKVWDKFQYDTMIEVFGEEELIKIIQDNPSTFDALNSPTTN